MNEFKQNMKEALFYKKTGKGDLVCNLCPHHCKLKDGEKGKCGARVNNEGKLFTENYGKITSINIDPIEKKPFYHFYPGSSILSLGTFGCNFHCKFCQNSEISQSYKERFNSIKDTAPEDVVSKALKRKNPTGIAFTYNEPFVWFEYMLDIAKLSYDNKLKNVVVTNGYINIKPLEQLLEFTHAFNVDLKSFDNEFYKNFVSGSLEPVKKTMETIRNKGHHLEVTILVIPGINDDSELFSKMLKWISSNLGKNTVLHINRYFPAYKMTYYPTPLSTLKVLFNMASEKLNYVNIGNVSPAESGSNTNCHSCSQTVIERSSYNTIVSGLDSNGYCKKCNSHVAVLK